LLYAMRYLRSRAPSTALGGRTPLHMLGAPVDSVNKLFTFGVNVFDKTSGLPPRPGQEPDAF